MQILESVIAKFVDYVPSIERKTINNLLLSNADFNEWLKFCESCIRRGISSIALHDEIYFRSRKISVDDDYISNILVDVMDYLISKKIVNSYG